MLCVGSFCFYIHGDSHQLSRIAKSSLSRKIIWAGLFLIALAAALFFWIKPSPRPPRILPNPNGYDDLVKAGEMIVGQLIDCDFDNSECIDEWKAFLEANRNAFELVRVGLSRKSRVPVEFKHHLAELKWLSLALQAEGRIAENKIDWMMQ